MNDGGLQQNSESVLVIEPAGRWRTLELPELWRYRELLYFLVWRDVKVRYRQTVLGAVWAIIQPLFATIMFSLLFGRIAKIPSEGLPYPLWAFAALLPWTYFANAVGAASNSLVGNAHLITKVYFPRMIIPTAVVTAALVDHAIALAVMIGMMLWYGVVPPLSALLTVPLISLVTSLLALGISVWLSALNVVYRDVRHVVPFALQLWMFATPIIYPLSMVPGKLRWVATLNPVTGVVLGYRDALFGRTFSALPISWTLACALFLILSGGLYFNRLERTFADAV